MKYIPVCQSENAYPTKTNREQNCQTKCSEKLVHNFKMQLLLHCIKEFWQMLSSKILFIKYLASNCSLMSLKVMNLWSRQNLFLLETINYLQTSLMISLITKSNKR